jgi:hypothetical protein
MTIFEAKIYEENNFKKLAENIYLFCFLQQDRCNSSYKIVMME